MEVKLEVRIGESEWKIPGGDLSTLSDNIMDAFRGYSPIDVSYVNVESIKDGVVNVNIEVEGAYDNGEAAFNAAVTDQNFEMPCIFSTPEEKVLADGTTILTYVGVLDTPS